MKITLAGLSLVMLCGLAHAQVTAEQAEADCNNVKNLAAEGDRLYRVKAYAEARERYEAQAAWSESCQLDAGRIATAYNNVALTHLHEGNYLKARAWLGIDAQDAKSVFNRGKYKTQIEQAESDASRSLEGDYWLYAGKSLWNVVSLRKAGAQYQAWFQGYAPGLMAMYYGPNMGQLSATLDFVDGRASYSMAEASPDYACTFTFTTERDVLTVDQDGTDCGFGHNVRAGGTYRKVEFDPAALPPADEGL
ncbi:tetratricopeptide repeat protein [Stutzerimonas azotifigens]|uniref:Tetratricopeptide repeat protein n=1 Tax=Stutzerimonas azotifigens TaxID=291995 RepID=A0ABR5Z654_9GAMM|nr:tetratricopeptide repeat protein [Stutzerimonas azotifigens]MBA1275697.1 tetratricopeptide repeat protein [Stutzerimonas azotifigens]